MTISLFLLVNQVHASEPLRENLPPKIFPQTEFYTIESATPSDEAGILNYRVTSPHAIYQIDGVVHLANLIHEIEVIERLRRNKDTSGFLDGVFGSIEDTGEGFVNLVTRPVDSVKGLGKAVVKVGGSIGRMFRSKDEAEKTSFGEKFMGSAEREIAKELGVDVYTRNPHMHAVLSKMAKGRTGGRGAAMVLKFLIPVAGLVSIALTASGVNATADEIVNDHSRPDLFRANLKALTELGFAEDDARAFLNIPYFTPRETTYFRVYLEKLQTVKASRLLFRQMLESKTQWQALKLLYATQIAADTMTEQLFNEVFIIDEGLALVSDSKLMFVFPHDEIGGDLKKRLWDEVQKMHGRYSSLNVEILAGGKVKDAFGSFETKECLLAGGDA